MPKVVLKEFKSWREWWASRNIQVHSNQRKYTTNVIMSYLQATHPSVTGYGLYVDETQIGYVFLIHAENPAQWIIDRLTIDKQYQRQGYGEDVVDQLIDMVYDFENSEMVIARYNTDNDVARQLFAKMKFEEQEDRIVRGRNIAVLEFEFEESEEDDEYEDDDELEDDEEWDEDDELDDDEEWDEDELEDDEEWDDDDELDDDIDSNDGDKDK